MNRRDILYLYSMRKFLQYSFYPGVILFTLFGSIYAMGILPNTQWIYIPGAFSLFFAVFFWRMEKVIPYRKDWLESQKDIPSDIARTFLTLPLASKIAEIILPSLLFYPAVWLTQFTKIHLYHNNMPLILAFFITLLVAEFFYYWMHRISHTLPFLWRFHAIHHGAPRIYWANAGRFHFFDAFLGGFAYLLPIILLGAPNSIILLIITFSAVTGFLEHVNIDFKAGWLNYIFNTAQLHRWHHSEQIKESNSNYGKALIIWDLVFNSFYFPKKKKVNQVGIEGDLIPNGFWKQGWHPYKKKNK